MFENLVVNFIGLAFVVLCIAALCAPQQSRPDSVARDI